ncbi:hypothetical protein MNBD_GAMMA22-2900 [hydrothermal vent metagenome]|uniref:DUF4350 domain-containing protein n=1 Tax=hydrothermal vent metagenome TaxID=652676 RepID=A0A3B1A6N1_9ZZZZ
MNNKIKIALSIGLLVIISALLVTFFTLFERVESERVIGLQGEAKFNPLVIAQRFLENSGIESESLVSMLKLKKMPEKKDVLLLATRRYDIGPAKRDEILNWVSSGGHLIIVAWPAVDSKSEIQDPILEELGIKVNYDETSLTDKLDKNCDTEHDPEKITPKTKSTKKEPDNSACDWNEYQPITVTILSERETSQVAFNSTIWLTTKNEKKANWVVNGEGGAHLLEYVKGKGLITVLSDYQFLTNSRISKYDHAAFFWYLVHFSNKSGKVWIVYKGDMPPLYEWLIENLWAPFLTLFFIIFIWIWSALPRFGALYPKLSHNRRNLIEHIRASGQFLWKNKFSDELIHETRNSLQEKISKRHTNWNKLSDAELYKRLAKQSKIDIELVEQAFTVQSTTKEHEFLLIIKTLERLRKSI